MKILIWLLAGSLKAATWMGGDYSGRDLVPADGDVLSGVFTNVGQFRVEPGSVTVFVAPGINLEVYASTINLAGKLNGAGRGQAGGGGGEINSAGFSGFGGGPSSSGGGSGGAAEKGGGGGGSGGDGGAGAGNSGLGGPGGRAPGGTFYGSTGTVTSPISSDDSFQGSGGGGGGGDSNTSGGSGGNGGGAIYLEASSITITGQLIVNGSTAPTVSEGSVGTHPGGGGGGGGGTIVVRAPGVLNLGNAIFLAQGGAGGDVLIPAGGTVDPGGGGAGGRVKAFYRPGAPFTMSISTGGGKPGRFGGFPGIVVDAVDPQFGSTGTASFGIIASPASNFAAAGVFVSSISWSWTASPSFGDAPGQQLYRIFPATITAPYPSPDTTVASGVNTVDTTGLTPNTTYQRMVTAFTAWGDSLPSNIFSTHTLASPPAPAAAPFSSMGDATLSFQWTSGTPANPDYTLYELQRSTDAGMAAAASSFGSSLSSAPAGLLPNTTYYFRSRAINLRNVPSEFTAVAGTATLASAPASPGLGSVFVTSLSFAWSAGANPSDTLFTVEISSDNFLSVTDSTRTLSRSATFFNLSPGTQYSLRAAAINRNSVLTAYTAVISTTPGILTNTAQPGEPGRPQSDRSFSSDGSVTFSWSEAQSPVGIFNYNFIVGSTPGGNDVLSSHTVTASSYTVYGLATGRSYYARVQARSNAGVLGPFSEISAGVPVFIPAQTAPVSKPINWPNPFNPAQGPTQIGLFLEEAATVMLRIFTLQGELVHEQSFALGPGNQIISWNGGNKSGVKVAPGGYIGRIEKRYGSRREVQKLKIAVLY